MSGTKGAPSDSLLARAAKSKIATIIVGPGKVENRVHSDLLIHHSGYFRAALTGSFKEAETQTVELLDIEPAVFDIFIHWLYTQDVSSEYPGWTDLDPWTIDEWNNVHQKAHDSGLELSSKAFNYVRFIILYAFADRFRVPLLQNSIVDYLTQKVPDWGCIQYDEIHFAFDVLPEQSCLLMFVVELCCNKDRHRVKDFLCDGEDDPDQNRTRRFEALPAQFHLAVSKFYMRHGNLNRWFDRRASRYYIHSCNEKHNKEEDEWSETENDAHKSDAFLIE